MRREVRWKVSIHCEVEKQSQRGREKEGRKEIDQKGKEKSSHIATYLAKKQWQWHHSFSFFFSFFFSLFGGGHFLLPFFFWLFSKNSSRMFQIKKKKIHLSFFWKKGINNPKGKEKKKGKHQEQKRNLWLTNQTKRISVSPYLLSFFLSMPIQKKEKNNNNEDQKNEKEKHDPKIPFSSLFIRPSSPILLLPQSFLVFPCPYSFFFSPFLSFPFFLTFISKSFLFPYSAFSDQLN